MGLHSAVVLVVVIALFVVVAPLTAVVVVVASWLFGFCHRFIVLPPTDCGQFIVWSPQLPVPTDLGERESETERWQERGRWYRGAVGWAGNHVICRLMKIYDMKAAK